jgi:hypothetical protein
MASRRNQRPSAVVVAGPADSRGTADGQVTRDRQPDMAMHRVEVPDAGRETAIDAAICTILLVAPPHWAFGDGPRGRPEGPD